MKKLIKINLIGSLILSVLIIQGCGDKEDKKIVSTEKPLVDFVESDFYWDKDTKPYKKLLTGHINKIRKSNLKCRDNDADVSLSYSRGTKDNPVFFITCGKGADIHNIYFSKSEAENAIISSVPKAIRETEAVQLCIDKIKLNAKFPESVDIHRFLGKSYTAHSNGNATVILDFNAKNGFGVETKNQARCVIQPNGTTDIWF